VPKFHSLLNWLLRAFTLTTAVGLYEFETNDVGVTEALRRIWNA
jgi:succinate dehydrogenase (ubiquinone) membrane anchor subunit